MSDDIEKLKEKLKRKKEIEGKYLSTGSTLLNLACSNHPDAGFSTGHYYLLAGDSKSGKTWISLTVLAEAVISKAFKEYRLIYDAPEDGALMDLRSYFGGLADRIEVPKPSSTAEEFYYAVDDCLIGDKPIIYVLDSMDAVQAEDDEDKFIEKKKAARADKEVSGSYGTAKAKVNSANINHIVSKLKKTGSILIVIAQAKEKLGFGFDKRTRAGGRSLTFYATAEAWFSSTESITKEVRGKKEKIGFWMQIQLRKNRQTGIEPTIDIPFYTCVGIDDTGSLVEFLIDRGHWNKSKGDVITAKEFDFTGKKELLIQKIEEENREKELKNLAGDLWNEIREACKVKRKSKYV